MSIAALNGPLLREGTIDEIAAIEREIPEFVRPKTTEAMAERLQSASALILVACLDGRPVAYKAGYALSPDRFYSWIGAVLPRYRRRGIARALLLEQERRLRALGYARVRVKSRNTFPSMLRLLIGEGYRIVGLEPSPSAEDPKIVFDKPLIDRTASGNQP